MLTPAFHASRRAALAALVPGPILLLGNGERPRNLPMVPVPFRQDSTFLYFTGCAVPGAAALMLGGSCTLFVPPHEEADALWHGPTPSLDTIREAYGVEAIRPIDELSQAVAGTTPKVLAVPDHAVNARFSRLLGRPLAFAVDHGDDVLVEAVIALRRTKQPEELDAMRAAARATAAAHRAVMASTRPGGHERALTALFEGALAARGFTTGYGTILTQRGEILHNHRHDAPLEAGRLLLLDGGGEGPSGHGIDVTRTWPVSGRFAPRQRAAYEAVLEAQQEAIAACRAGTPYREVHDTASRVLARFLCDEGLLRGSPDAAVEQGAHALFFPHGVGHLLGMDVHDLENFGDRPAYPPGVGRPEQFGTAYLRLSLPLEPDWVVTIEPGLYFVDAILDAPDLRDRFRDAVDFARADAWRGFGGIRIEDDVRITDGTPEVLTAAAPSSVQAIEEVTGSAAPIEALLC